MATNGNLGEYKVVISADYKDLQTQIKSVTDIIQQSVNDIARQFDDLSSRLSSSVGKINASIGNMSQELSTANAERMTQSVNKLSDAFDGLSKKIETGNTAPKKATDSYKTLEQQIRAARLEAEKQFGTSGFDTAKTNYQNLITKSNELKQQLSSVNNIGVENLDKSVKNTAQSMSMLEIITHKMRSHVEWMISASVSGSIVLIPVASLHSIATLEQQMAGMIQTLPQLHNNQEAVNQTATRFIGIAEQYGVDVDKIIEAGKLWSRGYKDVDDVMKLTSLSAKLAVADLMDVGLANRAVESTINSFGRQADAVNFATHVTDAWTNVAHNAQSSATDLATAMMRSGAAAHAVGVSFDMATALASTMIKTTGLEGENVGNALKSIYSSLQSKKAVEDLTNLGIEVYKFEEDGTRHFRKVEDVIVDLMLTSHATSKNMAKDLQDISGGKFQWSKVAALMSDYKDFIHSYTLSVTSTNFAEGQVAAQIDTINRRLSQLKQSIVGVLNSVGNGGLTNGIKDILTMVKSVVDFLQRVPASVYSNIEGLVKWYAIIRLSFTALGGFSKILPSIISFFKTLTAEGVRNTISTTANNVAHQLSTIATKQSATSSIENAAAKGVEKVATDSLTASTITFSGALALATGGVSILLTAITAATVGYGLYSASADKATQEQQKMDDETQKSIDIKKEELQNNAQQEKLLDTLSGAYTKLQSELAQTSEDSESYIRLQEDMKATDEDLAKIVSEDGMKRIRSGEDVQKVINDEKNAHTDKKKSIESEIKALREKQIEYTETEIENCNTRIQALQNEGTAWNAFQSIVSKAIGYLEKMEGELESAFGRVDKLTSITDLGKAAAQRTIDAGAAKIAQGENDIVWNPNDDDIQKIEKSKTDLQLKVAKIRRDAQSDILSSYEGTSIGGNESPETDSGSGSKGASRHVDNSNEAQAWRFLKGKGLSNEVIAGLIGNWEVESPGLNADNWDSAGESYGIGQWTKSSGRYQNMVDYGAQTNQDISTLAGQLNFAWHELTEGSYSSALPQIAQEATTPEGSAYAVAKYYEQPAWAENPERQSQARNIFDSMSSSNGEININDYEKQQKSVEEIQKRQYETLKKQYDVLVAQTELELRRKNQYMTANDKLYLWNNIMGVNGGNVDFNSSVTTGTDIGSRIAQETQSHYEGEQWKAADNDDLSRQCASFVTDVWKHVGINSVGSMNGDVMVSQAGNAYHTADSGYMPSVGDMINWAEHVGIYMGNGQYTARNSTGGVHTGSMDEAQQWFGSPQGYISVRELPDAKGSTSTRIFSTLGQFQKDNSKMIEDKMKESSELWKDKYSYNEAVAGAGGTGELARIESTIQQSVNAGKTLGKTEEKIYEEMLKIKGGQSLKGSPAWYNAQTSSAKLISGEKEKKTDFEDKATQKHINAINAMTEKEMSWANSHNLISNREVLDYKINKNETDYAKSSSSMESELSKTAQPGHEQDIITSFHKMMNSVTAEEATAEASHLVSLSKDTEATIKAVNKMQDAYEKYYQNREELAEKYEDSIRRYWTAGVSGLQSGLESAMDGILNKTKSFAQAIKDIFSSVWKALVSQFSKDFASRVTQWMNPIKQNKNENGTTPMSGSYNAVPGMGKKNGNMSGNLGNIGVSVLTQGLFVSTGKNNNKGALNITQPLNNFSSQLTNTFNATKNNLTNGMATIKSSSLSTIDQIKTKALQANMEERIAQEQTSNSAVTASAKTKTSVLKNISTMTTQMLAAMAIMWVLSSIFGGGGNKTETSTSSTNLGRNPASYYTTPSTISQVQVPSFDTGAVQIPQDMLAMVHHGEMVIPSGLADNIRSMGNTSNTNAGGKVVVHNNVNANAIDGRGIKEMLHTNNRQLAKSVKEAYRRFDTNV